MEKWFSPYPRGAAWYVISDYCIADAKKANDAFSFVIVLNHDTPPLFFLNILIIHHIFCFHLIHPHYYP